MKKFLLFVLTVMLFSCLPAAQGNIFSKATVKKENGTVSMVTNISVPMKNADAKSLKTFIKNDFYKTFGIGLDVEPELYRAVKIGNASIYKFMPYYKGIPVEGVYTVVTLRNGKIDRINNALSKIDLDVTKLVSEQDALKAAMAARNMKTVPKNYTIEKIITRNLSGFAVAYKVRFVPVTLADSRYYIVNAKNGKLLRSGHATFFDSPDSDAVLPDETDDSDPVADGDTEPAANDSDSETPARPEPDPDATNIARIWKYNPVITPEREEVELLWVAPYDDPELPAMSYDGNLISEKDGNGIRRIKAYNCPDDGTIISIDPADLGFDLSAIPIPISEIKIHTCHPMPLANKFEHGDFIYDDCDDGHVFNSEKMGIDTIDRCAEISMYHHGTKVYDYIRSLYSDISDKDEFYLENNTAEKPLNVISNFVMPDMNDMMGFLSGSNKVVPMDNAFFTEEMPMMSALLDSFGVSGDLLVFGQGTKCDFGYDGDVVYHEFGHATIYTTGIKANTNVDKYGMSVEPGAFHEGMADTFAFLMTDNSCTGEYASKGIMEYYESHGVKPEDVIAQGAMDKEDDTYCMRTAKNSFIAFEDSIGEVHADGQPVLAANWDIYQLVKGSDTQLSRDNLAKLFLKALYAAGESRLTFKNWAETLMDEVEKDDNFKDKAKEIKEILEKRNFFTEKRARSANDKIRVTYVPAGGSAGALGELTGQSGIRIVDDGKEENVGPGYIQLYYDVPEDSEKSGILVKGSVTADSASSMLGDLSFGEEPEIRVKVFYRKGDLVEYNENGDGLIEVAKDGVAEGGRKWYIPAEKGERYYFQFVSYSTGVSVSNISVEPADAPETGSEPTDDSDSGDLNFDDDPQPDDDAKKSSGSGCSLSI
ncbi:hypothetical protein J5834_04905 [bacterium]|nr:hypothetical protein [bacterium]